MHPVAGRRSLRLQSTQIHCRRDTVALPANRSGLEYEVAWEPLDRQGHDIFRALVECASFPAGTGWRQCHCHSPSRLPGVRLSRKLIVAGVCQPPPRALTSDTLAVMRRTWMSAADSRAARAAFSAATTSRYVTRPPLITVLGLLERALRSHPGARFARALLLQLPKRRDIVFNFLIGV